VTEEVPVEEKKKNILSATIEQTGKLAGNVAGAAVGSVKSIGSGIEQTGKLAGNVAGAAVGSVKSIGSGVKGVGNDLATVMKSNDSVAGKATGVAKGVASGAAKGVGCVVIGTLKGVAGTVGKAGDLLFVSYDVKKKQ
ncbi:MAG: hypothetical protein HQM14_18070, partial [SAR324 cluster bacterium]|nr:hypothetical protein [SAR324 cluster bacterium]